MLVVLGALALVAVLVGPRLVGALPDAALSELKEDPLATYEPPGGELVDTHEQKADRKNFLGMPVHAQYARVFELPAGADPRREIDRALAAALAAGWQLNEGSRGVSESGGSLAVGLDKLLPDRRDDVAERHRLHGRVELPPDERQASGAADQPEEPRDRLGDQPCRWFAVASGGSPVVEKVAIS